MGQQPWSEYTEATTFVATDTLLKYEPAETNARLKIKQIKIPNIFVGNSAGDLTIKNASHGDDLLLQAENVATGAVKTLARLDPDITSQGCIYLGAATTGLRINLTDSALNTLVQCNSGNLMFSNTQDGYDINFYADTAGGVQKTLLVLDPDTQTANVLGLKGASKTVSADSDAVDVAGISIVYFDTTAGNITIGGFANGATDQVIWLVKNVAANTLTMEHEEATGTQKIRTSTAGDVAITNFCCRVAVFKTTYWYLSN